MESINGPVKIGGIKVALKSGHFYLVAGEKKYVAGRIQEEFCLLMFRNIVLRTMKISTRSVLYLMAGFYLAVVVVELYLVSDVAYSLNHKLPPKILTTMDIFLL